MPSERKGHDLLEIAGLNRPPILRQHHVCVILPLQSGIFVYMHVSVDSLLQFKMLKQSLTERSHFGHILVEEVFENGFRIDYTIGNRKVKQNETIIK